MQRDLDRFGVGIILLVVSLGRSAVPCRGKLGQCPGALSGFAMHLLKIEFYIKQIKKSVDVFPNKAKSLSSPEHFSKISDSSLPGTLFTHKVS